MLYLLKQQITKQVLDISPYDAIVVGSGATGGIAALTLAEQGIKVLEQKQGLKLKGMKLVMMSQKVHSKDYQEF